MHEFHPLLLRQMKRVGINVDSEAIPEKYLKLFSHINNAYKEADQGHYIIERSMELSSQEMRELRLSLQKEKEIMQAVMSEGLCILDPFWKISNLNLTSVKLLCCSQQVALSKFYYEIFTLFEDGTPPIEIDIDTLKSKCKEGKTYHCEKGILKTFHGVTHPVSFSINPLPLLNNETFGGAVLIFRDITERLETELILQNSLRAAEQSNKAKTLFLANMSHEIRTPMNGILGMLQLLMHTELNDKQKHYVHKSFESANSLLRIIGDILDFSKIEAGKIEFENKEFNLHKELENIIILFGAQAKENNLKLTLAFDENINNCVKGDALRVKQIIINLINNAIKFTPKDGSIHMDAKLESMHQDSLTVKISISDTGIGIPEEKLSKIFDIFSQADESITRRYGGTGLGLAITKQLVEQMGGHICVHSTQGKGSTFIVTLKFQCSSPVEALDIQTIDKVPAQQFKANILVVEDNKLNQIVVQDMLKIFGCTIDAVNSGKLAIEAIQNNHYDIVFMDCHMPDIDGFITAKTIRDWETENLQTNNNIIIALTANTLKDTQTHCLEVGMNDYLSKPITFSRLQETLSKHLRK